jgi:hypothetical protein
MKSSPAMKSPTPEPSLSACSLAELEAQITELAGQLNAANYRWLTLIGEFDRRQGWWDGSLHHHVEHWVDGGETKLKNLVHLCRTHHRLVHEGGITVAARAGGGWRFTRPDGREFDLPQRDPAASAVDWTVLRDTHSELGIEIDSDTAATRWRGERMDYELGVWVLCHQHERAQHAGSQVASDQADDQAPDRADVDGTDCDDADPASNGVSDVSAETQRWWAT